MILIYSLGLRVSNLTLDTIPQTINPKNTVSRFNEFNGGVWWWEMKHCI